MLRLTAFALTVGLTACEPVLPNDPGPAQEEAVETAQLSPGRGNACTTTVSMADMGGHALLLFKLTPGPQPSPGLAIR